MSGNRGEAQGGLTHIACIMDGNGRWATRQGCRRIDGHAAGESAILAAVDAAMTLHVPWLTLFAFSTENWQRSSLEVDFLMKFNRQIIAKHGAHFHSRGIRVRYLGFADGRIPDDLWVAMRGIEALTRDNVRLTLTLAFNYGGRAEIVELVRRTAALAVGHMDIISEEYIREHFQYPDMPDIDLLIRTAGEQRISNFMLWHLAYAELVFLDTLWPDFKEEDLIRAAKVFHARIRTFGHT